MNFPQQKTIIIKIGTTSITKEKPAAAINLQGKAIVNVGINYQVLGSIASTAAKLHDTGYKVIIVSSGAMGLGVAKLGAGKLKERLEQSDKLSLTSFKQALTAVGQVDLMNAYETIFSNHKTHVGQVLITHKGLDDTERNENIKRTLEKLLALDVVPIINANDTVSSSEIEYGDNDSLSARVAVLMGAERLIIVSDAQGLYDSDPNLNPNAKLISEVREINNQIKSIAGESASTAGLGGMKSKIAAAEICINNNVAVDILGINEIEKIPLFINGALNKLNGTHFLVKS